MTGQTHTVTTSKQRQDLEAQLHMAFLLGHKVAFLALKIHRSNTKELPMNLFIFLYQKCFIRIDSDIQYMDWLSIEILNE